jgi:hypothetical protein
VGSGTSELKTSRMIFQFPSACLRQTSIYFPESGAWGWPGIISTHEYFPSARICEGPSRDQE